MREAWLLDNSSGRRRKRRQREEVPARMNVYSTWNNHCYWTGIMDAPFVWNTTAPQEMICSICSDKAEGYHFGAISCAACGAFFRRSVSDQKVYACNNRQCNITHDPKKRGGSCRFCRFLKCINSGMTPQDVRAKKNASQQNAPFLFRNMNQSSALIIEQIIIFRRNIAADRPNFEMTSGPITRTTLLHFLQQESENIKRICSGCPLFMQIIENLQLHFGIVANKGLEDPIRDIFLVIFVFESCFLTSSKGGVQLDRLVLPNLTHVDLCEHQFLDFLQYNTAATMDSVRHIHHSFSFLVQIVSRSFQSSTSDETYLAILFYTVLTESVPLNFRHRFAEVNRERLLADMNQADAASIQQFHTITGQMHQATRAFKEIIASFS